MKPKVSIVIVNWNTKQLLMDCIQSVRSTTLHADYEIIVVDNASTDGSVEELKRQFPQTTIIQNGRNMGFAAANNQGFRRSAGDLVLLLNSDTKVAEGTIDGCVDYLHAHPAVGVVGCKVLNPDGTFQSSYFRFSGLKDLLASECLGMRLWIVLAMKLFQWDINFASRYWGKEFSTATEVDVIAGCFLMTRKAIIESCGCLDEDFFFYGEEEEWCYRIKRAGWKILYFPQFTMTHYHGASAKNMPSLQQLGARKARLLVLQKTGGTGCAWLANVIMLAGVLLRIPAWAGASLLQRNAGSVARKPLKQRWETFFFHLRCLVRAEWRPKRLPSSEPATLGQTYPKPARSSE